MNRTLFKLAAVAGAYAGYRGVRALSQRIDFAGRVVVITGGSRGLGLVLARQLADEGALLAICARHADQLDRAAAELRGRGAVVLAEACDVTDSEQLERFLGSVRREFGPVDVLINNAGVIQVGPLETMTHEDYANSLAVHAWAPLRAMEAVLPDMRVRGGRIVNIASLGGRVAVPHLAAYCVGKFALVGLSRAYAAELGGQGVYVTTVCPGLMRTGSHHHALFKGRHRAEYTWFSLGASSPAPAMSAERAAAQILRACRYGRTHVTLSLAGRLAEAIEGVAPNLTADLAAAAARLLPAAEGRDSIGTAMREGRDSASRWSPTAATLLGERAAVRNNELS
jgi:NAD(P)-dependent dehydrogenase (short-subunit alcohol dehydrogenase family)